MIQSLDLTKTPEQVRKENNHATNAIYKMLKAQREPFIFQKVGNLGFVNPKTKDLTSLMAKIDRKIRTVEDKDINTADLIDLHYNQKETDLFNLIRDWARFAIIIPDYKSAAGIVEHFLDKFGGKVEIHDSEDYQAIHLHTNYKGVNLEFQFHTKEHAELKQATDIFYHKYKDVPIEKNSKIEEEYNQQRAEMIKHCQVIYGNSDFKENIEDIKRRLDLKQSKPQRHDKLSHFLMYAKKAEMVQNEIAEFLPGFLSEHQQMVDKTL